MVAPFDLLRYHRRMSPSEWLLIALITVALIGAVGYGLNKLNGKEKE